MYAHEAAVCGSIVWPPDYVIDVLKTRVMLDLRVCTMCPCVCVELALTGHLPNVGSVEAKITQFTCPLETNIHC